MQIHIQNYNLLVYRLHMNGNKMKHLLCLWIAAAFSASISAQSHQYGLPGVRNFTHSEYGGGIQSWSFAESSNGLLYFANNNGLLEFDGSRWVAYNSISAINRSVLADGNRIYVGAFNEFGYYEENNRGLLTYHSLKHLVKGLKSDLGEIWKIHKTDFGIVFSSSKALFIYKEGKIDIVYPRINFNPTYFANDILWLYDEDYGLMEYRAGKFKKVPGGDFFAGNKICSILSLNEDEILIGTTNKGVFRYNGIQVLPWVTEVNESLRKYEIYSAIRLKNNYFAFGTIQNGLYITDLKGNHISEINKERGLQNNTLLAIGQDSKGNIWLCLDNGISLIEFETPISYINNYFDLGTGYVACRYKDCIYFGTNQGLYYAKWTDFKNPSKSKSCFSLVQGTTGQVWSLKVIDNVLFCGHDNGIYEINGNRSLKISCDRGAWNFLKLPDKNVILAGAYRGLLILEKAGQHWQVRNKITGFAESSRFVVRDESGNIWIGHPYKGIYRLKPDSTLKKAGEIKLFNSKNGLPTDKSNFIYQIQNQICVTTPKGIYRFNDKTQQFEKSDLLKNYLKNEQQIELLFQDSVKNIWYYADKKLGVLSPQKDGSYKNTITPF